MRSLVPAALLLFISCLTAFSASAYACPATSPRMSIVKTPFDGGIREDIPQKYKLRYERWKAELLATEFGRSEWEAYARNPNFVLTIKMSSKRDKGAGTDEFLWDDNGKFVGATITLGDKLDQGFPDPVYYPVINSLAGSDASFSVSGSIIAATKLSHEIGHVNQTANAKRTFIETQNELVPVYISIFLKNGRNAKDEKLIELAEKMGGTPIEIWESREYWSEVNAMRFLNERISKENFYCAVFKKIRSNIETYAKSYEDRFGQYPEFSADSCSR